MRKPISQRRLKNDLKAFDNYFLANQKHQIITMTADEIRDEVAKKYGFPSWADVLWNLVNGPAKHFRNKCFNDLELEVMEEYASYRSSKDDRADETAKIERIKQSEFRNGDFFVWQSGMTGKREIHCFHSDAGYGLKTWTGFDERTGSSEIVNWGGVVGRLVLSPVQSREQNDKI